MVIGTVTNGGNVVMSTGIFCLMVLTSMLLNEISFVFHCSHTYCELLCSTSIWYALYVIIGGPYEADSFVLGTLSVDIVNATVYNALSIVGR